MKKILILIILLLPTITLASTDTCKRIEGNLNIPNKVKYKSSMKDSILSTPCVDAKEKIYDFADLLSDEEEENLAKKVIYFTYKTKLDIAIVTINDNPKQSAETYADDFYDYNDFKLNGILLLIDMDTRDYYISTSGSAILYYDDSRINSILDSAYTEITNEEYYNVFSNMMDKAIHYSDLGIANKNYEITKDGVLVRKTPWIVITIISIVPTLIITLSLALRNKKVKLATYADDYADKNSVNITKREDKFIKTFTNKVYIPPSSSSSGGTSHHSGSSGISHGGGGRHF